ncbi:hypothetical protein GOP47_0000668 [Adiantum capillus-veneris]|uniref:Uncharacterized protein n=1 Tax=Adiantum capillus-veneris TaxID=13818 RepID=A0A9D4VEB3_ADICA|nr:hypothetical protein GOP47_0000668 [Adiantum capillus-veneris]
MHQRGRRLQFQWPEMTPIIQDFGRRVVMHLQGKVSFFEHWFQRGKFQLNLFLREERLLNLAYPDQFPFPRENIIFMEGNPSSEEYADAVSSLKLGVNNIGLELSYRDGGLVVLSHNDAHKIMYSPPRCLSLFKIPATRYDLYTKFLHEYTRVWLQVFLQLNLGFKHSQLMG